MALRPGFGLVPMHFALNSNYGGMGDHISRIPAIQWALREAPHVTWDVYWHDYFVPLAKILLPEQQDRLRHFPVSVLDQRYNQNPIPYIDFAPKGIINSLHMNLVDHGFLTITGSLPPSRASRAYPRIQVGELGLRKQDPATGLLEPLNGKPYVVVTPVATSATRSWPATQVNATVRGLQDRGYRVVLLGKTEPLNLGGSSTYGAIKTDPIDRSLADIDLIDKISLVECLHVLARASAVLGLDNGLLHLAETVDCPQVWGFTSVSARLRVPEGSRSTYFETDVVCGGCQDKTFYVKQDFRQCMYGDLNCLPTMTSDKFLSHFDLLMDKLKES